MNTSYVPMTESYNSDTVTVAAITSPPDQLLFPVPVPDWSRARPVWSGCWPAHVYGFGCAFLFAGVMSVLSAPFCVRRHRVSPRSTVATSTVSSIVGIVCLAQSCVLLIDAYHSTGLLPVALVQVVHGLVFPGVVSTLTILDRIFSALIKPRQHLGSIKHPRLIAVALSIYLLSTTITYLVIATRPQTRLWLLLSQIVSLTWGCAAVFLVACQCLRLARYARLTARSRRQTAIYVRAKRHVEQCMEATRDSERRYELLKHLARLRVARTKADEFVQQQTMPGLDERGFSDIDLQTQTSTTGSSDQLPSDFEVTKTTTLKLSHNHFRYRRRSRRRRKVTGRKLAYGGREAVRDFTVTALAAARLLWSPSPDTDGCYDESSSWHVCLHPTDRKHCGRHKLNDSTIGDRKRHNQRTSVTGTDSDDDVDNDAEETGSSLEDKQRRKSSNTTNNEQPVTENLPNVTQSGHAGESFGAESGESNVSRCCRQLEPASFSGAHEDSQRQLSSIDASSRTYLLLDTARPLSRRLSSATRRLLRHATTQWRKSRRMTSRPVGDVESNPRIACVAESYVLDATATTTRHDVDDGSKSSSVLSTGNRLRQSRDIVLFENSAFDGRDEAVVCDEAVDNVEPGTSAQNTVEADDCRRLSTGYLADTELDNIDWKDDLDTATTSSLPLPGSSVYLGLNRLRGGRTVRLVWRTACVVVTSACVVCCLHVYSMLGVFGVLSNHRPASAWPWLGFQTLYR